MSYLRHAGQGKAWSLMVEGTHTSFIPLDPPCVTQGEEEKEEGCNDWDAVEKRGRILTWMAIPLWEIGHTCTLVLSWATGVGCKYCSISQLSSNLRSAAPGEHLCLCSGWDSVFFFSILWNFRFINVNIIHLISYISTEKRTYENNIRLPARSLHFSSWAKKRLSHQWICVNGFGESAHLLARWSSSVSVSQLQRCFILQPHKNTSSWFILSFKTCRLWR